MKKIVILRLFFLFATVLQAVSASGAMAQNTKVSLKMENATVRDVLNEIERTTGFSFSYNSQQIDAARRVTLKGKDLTVQQVLDRLFAGSNTGYAIDGANISLYRREPSPSTGAQQQPDRQTVRGVVNDETGEPLAGANIVVKGSTRGVSTDEDGKFEIAVRAADALLINYLGYETLEVPVGKQTYISVQLQPKSNALDEVTVVAFGTQKKSSVVASIETVNVKDLKIVGSNLTNSFAGKIPGVISYQTTGEPGADNAQFFVRGVTTFSMTGSNPLILIDGFEATSTDLARLQPDDIESFSVLKDAIAAALYGARGANGIILVNTKAGLEGKAKISIRLDENISAPTTMPELVDGVTYMRLYNEANYTRRNWTGGLAATVYSSQKIAGTEEGNYPMLYPNIDWYDMLFNRQTFNTKANINVSGGGQVATYYVAGGYDRETGLLKVDNRNNFNNNIEINRFHIRTNVIFKLNPHTTLDTRIMGRIERYNGPSTAASTIFNSVMDGNPVEYPAVYEPDAANLYTRHVLFGSAPGAPSNPYAAMVSGYTNRDESTMSAQATLMEDLSRYIDGLKVQLKGSYSVYSYYNATRSYSPYYYSILSSNPLTGDYILYCTNPTNTSAMLGDATISRNGNEHYYFEGRINWDRQFGKHSVGLMTVGIIEEYVLTGGSGSIFATLPERNMGNSSRLTYNFDERYFFEFAYGYNGSEKFAPKHRFGFFPSFGAAWLVSNEAFYGDGLKNILPLLKFKASWGKVGNDAIAGTEQRFQYLSRMATSGAYNLSFRWGKNYDHYQSGYTISQYANPDIGWEVSTKTDLAIELGLLKDQAIKIQADIFRDMRDRVFMSRSSLPASAGFSGTIAGNTGKVKSQGAEFSLDVKHSFTNDFWVTGRANYTYATNEYLRLDEPDYAEDYRSKVGHNINQAWGYVAERLFVDDAEIAQSPVQQGMYMAGDIKYTDVNGDGVIDAADMIAIGYPTVPEIQYGFGLSAGFKRCDMSFFFQGNANVSFFIAPTSIAPFIGKRNALKFIADDYWSETDPDVHAFWPRLSTSNITNNTLTSTWWLRDGRFLRLKTLEIGYTAPFEKMKIPNCRFYISGENLLRFSKFNLWDPEMGSNGLAYPINRRFNLGVQITLQ